MFAVIRTGGKQYKVAKDDVITVEKLAGEPGSTVTLADVLMVGEGAAARTKVAGAAVTAEVVEQIRADKVLIFKKKHPLPSQPVAIGKAGYSAFALRLPGEHQSSARSSPMRINRASISIPRAGSVRRTER